MTPAADFLRAADPERFRAALFAPDRAREALMALHGFNLELARAAWIAKEPMLAQIRLEWWREALNRSDDGQHPILPALRKIPRPALGVMIDARLMELDTAQWTAQRRADYVDGTAGGLVRIGAALVADQAPSEHDMAALAPVGAAFGLAGLLRAGPELLARGRWPFAPDEDIPALAAAARAALCEARRDRALRRFASALLFGWRAEAALKAAAATGFDPARPMPQPAPFTLHWGVVSRGMRGRW